MTATASTNTNEKKSEKRLSPALHNWRQNVLGDKKLFIILAILHLIAAPAVILAMIISVYTGQKEIDAYAVIGTLTTGLAGFLGIFPAVDSFSCLHNKLVVDMRLSLPLNAKQRFFSNYFSGLFTYVAPFLGAQVVSLLLTGYGLIFMEGRTFYHEYFENGRLVRQPFVCDYFSYAAPMLLKLILCGLLAMLMLYTVTVLITVCCGSKFESIAYTILVNVLLPLTVICVTFSIFDNLYGISPEIPMLKIISFTSVAGAIVVALDWSMAGEMFYGAEDLFDYGVWAAVYFLIIAALCGLAFFLYRKRRAEQVSKPFVFKLAYYITITCAMFCMVALLLNEADFGLFPAVIITAIVYMIFEVVTNRGFKRFWLSIIKYSATFLAAFGIIWLGDKTDGFGAVSRVPLPVTVTSAEVSGYAVTGAYGIFDYTGWYAGIYDSEIRADEFFADIYKPLVFTDKENIETIIDAHNALIDFYNKYKTDESFSLGGKDQNLMDNASKQGGMSIRYHLAGGGTLERDYYCLDSAAQDILMRLDLTDEYKSQTAERFKKYISEIPGIYEAEMEKVKENPELLRGHDGKNRTYEAYASSKIVNDDPVGISIDSLCRRGFYEQFAEAYAKDIMAVNEENYYHSELHNIWNVNLTGDMRYARASVSVPESFSNTVELLEYFGFEMKRVEDMSDEEISSALIRSTISSWPVRLYSSGEWRDNAHVDEPSVILPASFVTGVLRNGFGSCYVYDYDRDMADIVRGSLPMHIADENGYIICIYGNSYSVPAELADTAKRVPRSARNEEIEKLYRETVQGASSDSTYAY